jgi:hypothetical protein
MTGWGIPNLSRLPWLPSLLQLAWLSRLCGEFPYKADVTNSIHKSHRSNSGKLLFRHVSTNSSCGNRTQDYALFEDEQIMQKRVRGNTKMGSRTKDWISGLRRFRIKRFFVQYASKQNGISRYWGRSWIQRWSRHDDKTNSWQKWMRVTEAEIIKFNVPYYYT